MASLSGQLIADAISNIWCQPSQDKQAILKPRRLTLAGGTYNTLRKGYTYLSTPTASQRYHIYTLGPIPASAIGVSENTFEWVTVKDFVNLHETYCEVYTESGIQLSRHVCYLCNHTDGSFYLAVREQLQQQYLFDTTEIYVRFHTPSYLSKQGVDRSAEYISCDGDYINNGTTQFNLITSYNSAKTKSGQTICTVNGYHVAELTALTAPIGSVAQFIHDGTIVDAQTYNLLDLKSFTSTLDSKQKYILHKTTTTDPFINYKDDIEIYVINTATGKGVYYNKNKANAVRMLTHRDYSICSEYVDRCITALGNPPQSSIQIKLYTRKTGTTKTVIDTSSKILELYQLETDSKIIGALSGADSGVSVWLADSLESSEYTRLMDADLEDFTKEGAAAAYGYTALNYRFANPIVDTQVFSSQLVCEVPLVCQTSSTAFEYDAAGHLLGWYLHSTGAQYACTNQTAARVEFIRGIGGNTLDEYENTQSVIPSSDYEYRAYTTPNDGNAQTNVWTDVTDSGEAVTLTDTAIQWLDTTDKNTIIRSNRRFICYETQLLPSDRVYRLNVQQGKVFNSQLTMVPMVLPMGQLDVFVNGKLAIPYIDYIFDFPVLAITSKELFVDQANQPQAVVIRYVGHPDRSVSSEIKVLDVGFCINGKLSVDSEYDVRTNKALRITVGGSLKDASSLKWGEDSLAFNLPGITNGTPFCVTAYKTCVKSLTGLSTTALIEEADLIDADIKAYLTSRKTLATPPALNPITNKYKLYSPFLAKVIAELLAGNIGNTILMSETYGDTDVRTAVAPYLAYYDTDPLKLTNNISKDYVTVHAHALAEPIVVSRWMYVFMSRVVRLYGNGLVNLSGQLAIS